MRGAGRSWIYKKENIYMKFFPTFHFDVPGRWPCEWQIGRHSWGGDRLGGSCIYQARHSEKRTKNAQERKEAAQGDLGCSSARAGNSLRTCWILWPLDKVLTNFPSVVGHWNHVTSPAPGPSHKVGGGPIIPWAESRSGHSIWPCWVAHRILRDVELLPCAFTDPS